jgi:hypothetical protein
MELRPKSASEGNVLAHTHDQANRERAETIDGVALKKAKEQGQPFVREWRLRPSENGSSWHVGDDAGCGCGPVD